MRVSNEVHFVSPFFFFFSPPAPFKEGGYTHIALADLVEPVREF